MNKSISLAVLLGVVGLVVGYFLFGKIGNGYIKVGDLLSAPKSGLAGVGRQVIDAITDIDQIRRNILISGGVGAALGLVGGLSISRPRR